ncbi:MAG: DCC1-like thiol-disulfide oxidoreductase family protein [Bdellovibrionota bacterium]
MQQNIIFFDGHCNLCNKTVDFLIKVDRKKVLRYAPISGKTARDVGLKLPPNKNELSIIFFKDQKQIHPHNPIIIKGGLLQTQMLFTRYI